MSLPRLAMNCKICQGIAAEIDEAFVVRTAKYWRVALAHDQLYLGRAYVTARFHVGQMSVLPQKVRAEFYNGVWIDYERRVKRAFGPAESFDWTCLNNGDFSTALANPHVHWDVRPRYAHAPKALGYTWPDPNFGHHYQLSYQNPRKVNDDVLARLAQLLREA
jgi:diadenosine tetraphosphate (Ap4A) HIT family hydrolase